MVKINKLEISSNILRKKRVLIVDEHDCVIDAVTKTLKKENIYEIEVARNGLRAYLHIDTFSRSW